MAAAEPFLDCRMRIGEQDGDGADESLVHGARWID